MTKTLILTAAIALAVGLVLGAIVWQLFISAPEISMARTERGAAQAETARILAREDWHIRTGIEARGSIHAMYVDWGADAAWLVDELTTAHTETERAQQIIHELSEVIRERGMHEAAVAAAHEAVVVEPTGALPLLRAVPGVVTGYTPVDFDAWWAGLDVGTKALPAGSVAA